MTQQSNDIKPLVIADSSPFSTGRTPKHLLPHKDGRPAYQHTLEHLIQALPHTTTFYISLRDPSQTHALDLAGSHKIAKHVEPIYDPTTNNNNNVPIPIVPGPAAGLIAAHVLSPTSTWLVVGTDAPLPTPQTLRDLLTAYVPPVTCIRADGNRNRSSAAAAVVADPLLAVWSPHALGRLLENVAAGKCGPGTTVEELDGKILTPPLHDGDGHSKGSTFGTPHA